jgi:HAD superfamily hydrolase (TIGR01509 family)
LNRAAARRALIFDYDGLIVDSETALARVLVDELAARGVPVDPSTFAHLFGATGPEIDREWEALTRDWFGDIPTIDELDKAIQDRVRPLVAELPPLPGAIELLDAALEAGWATALATGKSRARLDPELERLALVDRFHAVVTSGEVPRGKPAPDVFLEAARRVGVEPSDCVVLEDSVPGCEAALAAGMAVVACPCELTSGCEFPDGVLRVMSLADVRLEGLPTMPAGRGRSV